ncbi:23S rRNA methyltransferase [Pyruvatibacter mobilis]|uniref:Ribosomal RNA large subunit methyltransferase E n=1 Tax=Pyruvatibacter mobilis TaxID=1712261 RepID=A0A845QBA8_9HYPH|nr:RlmE family RNA methyltransferase [Pyruvatibacter mobilis]NBG95486.1 23S rRNA methyltransferase [Pyruvatibacter mobilis]QJD75429.1 RlmE family RNA methyltransferase [Pyruvatibacter mobilis]
MARSRRGGGSGASAGGGGGARELKQRVRTARGRKTSSTLWLQRQLNDPYVAAARRDGYRSRAAYKLAEIDEKYHILKPGYRVVDLGAAPGGWTQIAVKRTGVETNRGGHVIGIDLLPIETIPGATLLEGDFMADDAPDRLKAEMGGPADVVMSDMAASATGHKATDHLRIMHLCELALEFAIEVLKPGGSFLAKVLQGGAEKDLMDMLRTNFKVVRHVKPKASRADSAEMYVLATGFKGRKDDDGGEGDA